jgi:2'-5' RNA ligase
MDEAHSTDRLFLALPLPAAARAVLARLAEPLNGVAWVPPGQLHLTLRFLGDIDAATRTTIEERLASVRVAPFLLPLAGVGAFPPQGAPRTVWAGTGAGHPRLFQLRQRLDDALLAAGLALDVRTFIPHVTLARCRPDAAGVTAWLRRHRDLEGPPVRVDCFDLCASELRPAGAVHTVKRRFPLAN